MEKCIRCNGKGFIEFYKENKGGICFICWGDGYEFKTKEEKYEFYSVKYLFELEEHIKEDFKIAKIPLEYLENKFVDLEGE